MSRRQDGPIGSNGDEIGPIEFRFTPRSRISIRLARNVLAQWLRAQPRVKADCVDDLLVAASELCTNAVEHASGSDGCVALRARIANESVLLEIEDDGSGFDGPSVLDLREMDPHAEHGRGLFIVQHLVDDVEFERGDERMIVRCCKDGILDDAFAGVPTGAAAH